MKKNENYWLFNDVCIKNIYNQYTNSYLTIVDCALHIKCFGKLKYNKKCVIIKCMLIELYCKIIMMHYFTV